MMMDEATAGDIGGGVSSTDTWSVTCSGEHVGVDGNADTAAGVGVLSAASGLRLPGGKDTVKTSSVSSPSPVGSCGGVGARGWDGCAGAWTNTSEPVPGSLTRYEGPWLGRGR
jgi:hypothetical protein